MGQGSHAFEGLKTEHLNPTRLGRGPCHVTLSRRAKDALFQLKEELPVAMDGHFLVTESGTKSDRLWSFAGTVQNRTWAQMGASGGKKLKFDALGIDAPASIIHEATQKPLVLTDADVSAFIESIKFANCLPATLLKKMVERRYFLSLDQS